MSLPAKAAPARLVEGKDPVGRLLDAASGDPVEATTARRERVWSNLTRRPQRSLLRWLVPAAMVTAAVAFYVLRAEAPVTVAAAVGEVESQAGGEGWATVHAGQALAPPVTVRTADSGRTFLRTATSGAVLLEHTRARLTGGSGLRLEQGTVVASSTVVTAGDYRIEGTSFAVRVGADQAIEVFAHEGSASVRGPNTELEVDAAHGWSSLTGPSDAKGAEAEQQMVHVLLTAQGADAAQLALTPQPNALPANADALAYDQATQLERDGHPNQALAIHDRLARGDGSRAEASLYVAGRIRLRVFDDAKGALAAFTEHQRRFPGGSLAQEVALSAIEAQLRLEQFEPALAAMEAFVTRYPDSERLHEVHFLQAQVHSQRGDCARALPLFAGLLEDPRRADDALYLTAYCEQELNLHAAARKHLQEYLKRFPAGKHLKEARAALGKR